MQFAPFEAADAHMEEHVDLKGRIYDIGTGEDIVEEFNFKEYDKRESNTLPNYAFVGLDPEKD